MSIWLKGAGRSNSFQCSFGNDGKEDTVETVVRREGSLMGLLSVRDGELRKLNFLMVNYKTYYNIHISIIIWKK